VRLASHFDALGAPAFVLGRALESTPRFDPIQSLRERLGYRTTPWRDRCHALCHAKPTWLAEQAEQNPFESSSFYWVDAGLAYPGLIPRRYLPEYFGPPCQLFAPAVLEGLAAERADAPLILIGQHPIAIGQMHNVRMEAHQPWIGDGRGPMQTQVVGGLFGGSGQAVRDLAVDYDAVLAAMLEAEALGTEENVLSVLYHRDPGRARLLTFTTWYHEDSGVRLPGPDDVPFYRLLERLAGEAEGR
jgi:hypothetical protein